MRSQRKIYNILKRNTEQKDEVKNGQGAVNVRVKNENIYQEKTEYDNVI